jgi:serine/threonine protein kinase
MLQSRHVNRIVVAIDSLSSIASASVSLQSRFASTHSVRRSSSSPSPMSALPATMSSDASPSAPENAGHSSADMASDEGHTLEIPTTVVPMQLRYRPVKQLHDTIYGRTLLCEVIHEGASSSEQSSRVVVVKETPMSKVAETQQRSPLLIGEDVHKEARILRFLGRHPNQQGVTEAFTTAHVDRTTCGLSQAYLTKHIDPATGMLSSAAVEDIQQGARYIPLLFDECEEVELSASSHVHKTQSTPRVHYMVSEYASRGDLFGIISDAPKQRLDEYDARILFRQILLAVRYAHARSVVHLDISVENVCVTDQGEARLIDWGLATVHPECASAALGGETPRTVDTVHRLVGVGYSVPSTHAQCDFGTQGESTCNCKPCTSTVPELNLRIAQQVARSRVAFPQLAAAVTNGGADTWHVGRRVSALTILTTSSAVVSDTTVNSVALYGRCKMLMRPVCTKYLVPGKYYTSAPELVDQFEVAPAWDAYAADSFALGVLLYVMLTGVPPFKHPHAAVCKWYKHISSGNWRSVEHPTYQHLSENARDLIDACIKNQFLRPTVDQLLRHAWMDPDHPRSHLP